MSQQVLARKWRPRQFDQIIGQPYAVQALANALDQNHLHHAYLLTGIRGVGKTTIARILAKCLNCEQGVSSKPCNTCSNCQEVDSGRFPDLFEIDAASRTKVEDTRELLDNVQYLPTKGRYKIYLIDEVHMLSGHSFNALLKTLEEPPTHVIFVLATTDPQKLPATVLSRCLQFHLQAMLPKQIAQHLATILEQEKIPFEAPALDLIAKAADGSMRDALSLLDQSIAYGNGEINTEAVKNLLGTIDQSTLYNLLTALSQQDANQIITHIDALAHHGTDFSQALAELLSQLNFIAIAQLVPNNTRDEITSEISALAQAMSREDVQLYYQIGLHGQRDLPFAPNPQSAFEMTLLRMLAFTPNAQTTPKAKQKTNTTPTSTSPQKQTLAEPTSSSQSWRELLDALTLSGATRALAQQCQLKTLEQDHLRLTIDQKHQAMLTKTQITRLQDALQQYLNRPMKVHIDVATINNDDTPAGLAEHERQTQKQAAEQALLNDFDVQRMMQTFDATLVKDSITPNETIN